jgi:hypothetical protein
VDIVNGLWTTTEVDDESTREVLKFFERPTFRLAVLFSELDAQGILFLACVACSTSIYRQPVISPVLLQLGKVCLSGGVKNGWFSYART